MREFLQQVINGLSVGSIYALIAVGYTMVYGVLQLINFAHGDIFMVGAIVSFYVASRTLPATFPWWLHAAVWMGVVLGFAVPILLGRDWRAAARGVLPFLLTYAVLVPLIYVTS